MIKKFIYFFVFTLLIYYLGFKSGIHLRAYIDHKQIPHFREYFIKYKKNNKQNIYYEALLKYLSITNKEYKDMIMDTLFELETKPWMYWIINTQLQKDDVVLDIGGATGIQWRVFEDKVNKKNLKIFVTDINQNSLDIGKLRNTNPNISFLHVNDINNNIKQNITKILLCGVYMQMDEGQKIIRHYVDKYPNAKVIVMHSVFPKTFNTKILNFLKKYIFKYTYLEELQGRAMTDEDFKKELNQQNLKIEKEYILSHIANSKRINNDLKAYIIVKKSYPD